MDKYLFVASMIILVSLGLVFYLTRDKKIPESASGESSDVLQKIIARLELRGFGQWPLPNRGIGFANQEFGIEFFPQRKTELINFRLGDQALADFVYYKGGAVSWTGNGKTRHFASGPEHKLILMIRKKVLEMAKIQNRVL